MTTPYFYIIQEKSTLRKYAGCRYKNNCHPDELLTNTGYKTSSTTIKKLLKKNGLDSFSILEIVTENTAKLNGFNSIYEYETDFLVRNDCANSKEWFNTHNNQKNEKFGSDEFNRRMLKAYGFDNVSKNEHIKEKKKKTSLRRYKTEIPQRLDEVKIKAEETNLERYGTKYAQQNKKVREKTNSTNLEKYGNECLFQSEPIKEKIRATNLEKYGVECVLSSKEIRNKINNTVFEKYGVSNVGELEETKEKMRKTSIEKYGVDSYAKTKESKDRNSKRRKGDYWFFNLKTKAFKTSKELFPDWLDEDWEKSSPPIIRNCPKIECEYCKKIIPKFAYVRFHGEKCKMKL